MTDLLQMHDGPPSPRSRGRKRGPGRLIAVLVVLLLTAGLVGGAVYAVDRVFGGPSFEDFSGQGTGEVVVQIAPGSTAGDIGGVLAEAGVIASRGAFFEVARTDPRATQLAPGSYRLRERMSAAAAFELLLDPSARLVGRVTVPEGLRVEQTLQVLADGTEIPLEDLQAAAEDTDALGLPEYAEGRLEGFLFPATYELEPGTTAVQALSQMVDRFEQAAETVGLEEGARALGRTPYEIVIVASLIEREVKFDDEYPRVAQVVYNRLEQGERIDIDAAVLYGLGRTSGGLTRSDLDSDSPYNLRKFKGLPPTPISSPGEATLAGALDPSGGDELFYVLGTKEGRSVFTTNLRDHNRAVEKAKAEGIF